MALVIVFRAVRPVVDKTYPLREARAAHERLKKKEQFGKVVLNP